MRFFSLRSAWVLILLLFVVGGIAIDAQVVNVSKRGVALEGYDAVAYHTQNEAIKGARGNRAEWNDAIWYFASEENLELFLAEPERYAPQYGGYCAYAVANNATAPIDPEAFAVYDGKLYLNFSQRVQRRWARGRDRYITAADDNWPSLLSELQDE